MKVLEGRKERSLRIEKETAQGVTLPSKVSRSPFKRANHPSTPSPSILSSRTSACFAPGARSRTQDAFSPISRLLSTVILHPPRGGVPSLPSFSQARLLLTLCRLHIVSCDHSLSRLLLSSRLKPHRTSKQTLGPPLLLAFGAEQAERRLGRSDGDSLQICQRPGVQSGTDHARSRSASRDPCPGFKPPVALVSTSLSPGQAVYRPRIYSSSFDLPLERVPVRDE
jgi:hypothetical protein